MKFIILLANIELKKSVVHLILRHSIFHQELVLAFARFRDLVVANERKNVLFISRRRDL